METIFGKAALVVMTRQCHLILRYFKALPRGRLVDWSTFGSQLIQNIIQMTDGRSLDSPTTHKCQVFVWKPGWIMMDESWWITASASKMKGMKDVVKIIENRWTSSCGGQCLKFDIDWSDWIPLAYIRWFGSVSKPIGTSAQQLPWQTSQSTEGI